MCMYMHHICAVSVEKLDSQELEFKGAKPPGGYRELNSCPLQEQQVLFVTKCSLLQSHLFSALGNFLTVSLTQSKMCHIVST